MAKIGLQAWIICEYMVWQGFGAGCGDRGGSLHLCHVRLWATGRRGTQTFYVPSYRYIRGSICVEMDDLMPREYDAEVGFCGGGCGGKWVVLVGR
jgi:hypothetical protein